MNTRREIIIGGGAIALASLAPASAAAAAEPEVTAAEDLMREHGVIRRALLVYAAVTPRLRADPGKVDAAALHRTGELFRRFGEDYHEQELEEKHIFPVIRKMPGVASYADVLTKQHDRGREITRMYEHHAAREDTIVFPAWKRNFTNKQLDALADEFEDIERKTFGIADIAQFTPPPPPKR